MKKFITNIIGFIFGIYILGISGFALYFNWNYAKENGFIKWVLLGEIIPTAKAIIWPYYVLNPVDSSSIKHFIESISYANMATKIINKQKPFSPIDSADMEKVIEYHKKALAEAKKVNISILNKHYAGWGDHFKEEYVKGLDLLTQSYENHDVVMSLTAQKLIDLWDTWYSENIDNIKGK